MKLPDEILDMIQDSNFILTKLEWSAYGTVLVAGYVKKKANAEEWEEIGRAE